MYRMYIYIYSIWSYRLKTKIAPLLIYCSIYILCPTEVPMRSGVSVEIVHTMQLNPNRQEREIVYIFQIKHIENI